jgi:hypothetical protein
MTGLTRRYDTGRGHYYKLDGDKVDGVTSILGDGWPKPALVYWAANTVSEYVADRLAYDEDTDQWNPAQLLADLEAKAQRDRRKWRPGSRIAIVENLKRVQWDERDAAANKGTTVHKFAERLARGEEVDVPEPLVGHVDSYLRFREEWEPTDELLELVVVNRRHRYMGTLDLICRIGGMWWLIDIKTNRSGIFPETAYQLTAYRHAETYIDGDGVEQPMIPVDRVAALWLRADGYDLIPVQADERAFRRFLYIQQVAIAQKDDTVLGEALAPPVRSTAA